MSVVVDWQTGGLTLSSMTFPTRIVPELAAYVLRNRSNLFFNGAFILTIGSSGS